MLYYIRLIPLRTLAPPRTTSLLNVACSPGLKQAVQPAIPRTLHTGFAPEAMVLSITRTPCTTSVINIRAPSQSDPEHDFPRDCHSERVPDSSDPQRASRTRVSRSERSFTPFTMTDFMTLTEPCINIYLIPTIHQSTVCAAIVFERPTRRVFLPDTTTGHPITDNFTTSRPRMFL